MIRMQVVVAVETEVLVVVEDDGWKTVGVSGGFGGSAFNTTTPVL